MVRIKLNKKQVSGTELALESGSAITVRISDDEVDFHDIADEATAQNFLDNHVFDPNKRYPILPGDISKTRKQRFDAATTQAEKMDILKELL